MEKSKENCQKSKRRKSYRKIGKKKLKKDEDQLCLEEQQQESDSEDYGNLLTAKQYVSNQNQLPKVQTRITRKNKIPLSVQNITIQKQQLQMTYQSFAQKFLDIQNSCVLSEQLDFQIKQTFQSFFRTQNIPNHIILSAKKLLLQQIQNTINCVVRKHVIIKNKNSSIHSAEFLKVIQGFGDKYKQKILRTYLIEHVLKKTNPNKKDNETQ